MIHNVLISVRCGSLTLAYRYTEVDVIPCSGEDGRKEEEREAQRAAMLK